MNQTFKLFVTTFVLSISLFFLSDTKVLANAFNFNSSTGPDTFTCYASDLGCEQVNHVYFINATGDFLWQTTAWTSSPNQMLEYYSWTKDFTWEQDTNPSQQPIESHLGVILPVRMKNNGIPGTYRGTLYVDAKTCNRAVTPWDCYFRGAASYTMTMTVLADPTATPTTPPPTATPTTQPPSATATPTGSQPTLTPTPTTPSGQATPTPISGVTSPTPTSSTSQTTANSTTNSGTADSTGTQTKPKTCDVTAPNAPKLLSVKPVSQTSVTLEWSAVSEATHYSVSYGKKSGIYLYGVSNTGNTTSFTVKSLGKNSTYYFVVQAISDCAPSKISNELSTLVDQTLPEKSFEELVLAMESSESAGITDKKPDSTAVLNQKVTQVYPFNQLVALVLGGFSAMVIGLLLLVKKSPMNPVSRFISKMTSALPKYKQLINR
jgi:hypothetical protein